MPTMKRVREIEELCRKAQIDPRITQVLCMLAERQRVQHQQMYMVAEQIMKMQELLQVLINKMGVRDDNLRKLGVEEMLKNFDAQRKDKGVTVESVEKFDEDTDPTNLLDQGTKH